MSKPRVKLWNFWKLTSQHPFRPQNKSFFIIPFSSRAIGLKKTMWLETIKESLGGGPGGCCRWILPDCLVFCFASEFDAWKGTITLGNIRWSQHSKGDRVNHAEKWIQSSAMSFLEQSYFQTFCLGDKRCPHCFNQKELSVSFPYNEGHLTLGEIKYYYLIIKLNILLQLTLYNF